MYAAPSLLATTAAAAAAFFLHASPAAAAPPPPAHLAARQTPADAAAALQPWVTVGEDGKPRTVTPVATTVSGVPTVVSAAPDHLTATLVTSNFGGQISTATLARPPGPTATAADGTGAFLPCHKAPGDPGAPFCAPAPGAELNPGNTYYFTWDPTFFAAPNTSVRLVGDYVNETTGLATTQAFSSDVFPAAWGYWSWPADKALMPGGSPVNISVHLAALKPGGKASDPVPGPRVLLAFPPGPKPKAVPAPAGPALYVGLPVILGFVVLCVFGTLLWNRRQRVIGLGNVMSRGRGGYGVGKSARARLGLGKKKKDAALRVQLMEREVKADGNQVYRDAPDHPDHPDHLDHPGIARRDSDALGSLAGTPTLDRRMDFDRPPASDGHDGAAAPERNLFRDELKRQNGERR